MGEHNLCLSCLLSGHRLSQCRSRNRCKIENCGMRHHTLLHEVDLKFIERARAKHQRERVAETEGGQAPPPHQEGANVAQNQAVRDQYHHSAHSSRESGGRALVEVLPVIIVRETGTQQVVALRDLGCNTTLMDERLALTLGLKGREIDLEIQGVYAQKAFTSQHIKRCYVARVGKEEVKYLLLDVKTIRNLNGPDQ